MKKISMRELATELNVSIATVSKALSDSYEISEQTNKKFWKELPVLITR